MLPGEYSGKVVPILPNEARLPEKNSRCSDSALFIGLPPSVKERFSLPAGKEFQVELLISGGSQTFKAFIAGGRGGMVRLSMDLIEACHLPKNLCPAIRIEVFNSGEPKLQLMSLPSSENSKHLP